MTIDKFVQDTRREITHPERIEGGITIDGVVLERLVPNNDHRGSLIELMTTRDGPIETIVHAYQVICAPGSLRGWAYHKRQYDRFLFTMGDFQLSLLDIRPGSSTHGHRMDLYLGEAFKGRLRIPPLVAHAVRNIGITTAAFINMPTQVYDPANPDKFRYDGPSEDWAPTRV